MAEQIIQGINVKWRDLKESIITEDGELIEGEEILYASLPKEDQYFRPIQHPFSDDDLVAIANKEHQYTATQKQWVDNEKNRITQGNGVYASINGQLKYLPASYWGYVNFWTLENGKKPEYREADRRFFLFMEYICFSTDVLALCRGKGRRKGATSQGAFWIWWICGRNAESNGGIMSFNDDAAQAVFQKMFMRGFKDLLPCFVEPFDSKSENFIRFVEPVEKEKKGVPIKRKGLNSYISYQGTTINSFDSIRLTFGLFDESGKYEKMDINTYWSKVSPTLKEGKKKVGFAYMPTTVNPKKKGGENFKKFWGLCDQNAINPKTGEPFGLNTPNKVVRYLDPATEGYAGCIDKYGESIIDDPAIPLMGNDGLLITEGAMSVITKERELKTGDQLMEHRRDFPLTEFDMFAFETGMCEFNELNFIDRITYLENTPSESFWRQCRLMEVVDEKTGHITVKPVDDPKGEWFIGEFAENANNYTKVGGLFEAKNKLFYQAGADTYRNIFAEDGSEGVVCITKKSNIVDGIEKGLKPAAFFVGRPKLIKQFNRQAFLGCIYYGCTINFEIDAGTWFYEDFTEWGGQRLLEWTPAIDPLKRGTTQIKPGTESASPFQLAKQLEVAKLFYDGDKIDGYNGNVHRVTYIPLLKDSLAYSHSERTPHHLTVAFMMSLLPILGQTKPPVPETRRMVSIFPTFAVRKPA